MTSGWYASSAATISSSGVVTETRGAPPRPACMAAITCCERWRAVGAPIPTMRVCRVHAEPRERPDEHRDPVRELLLRVDEQPGHCRMSRTSRRSRYSPRYRAPASASARNGSSSARRRPGSVTTRSNCSISAGLRTTSADRRARRSPRRDRARRGSRASDGRRGGSARAGALAGTRRSSLARPVDRAAGARRRARRARRGRVGSTEVAATVVMGDSSPVGTVSPRMNAAWSSTKVSGDTASGSSWRSAL